MRFFNTEGPVNCRKHYCLSPLDRFDLTEILDLIAAEKYFLLHAPRQTGKTSCLLALMEYLHEQGTYRALYANIEGAQAARENVEQGITTVVQDIALWARDLSGDDEALSIARKTLAETTPTSALGAFLTTWCKAAPKPTILLLDEVDALVGDTLISLLMQLRAGWICASATATRSWASSSRSGETTGRTPCSKGFPRSTAISRDWARIRAGW